MTTSTPAHTSGYRQLQSLDPDQPIGLREFARLLERGYDTVHNWSDAKSGEGVLGRDGRRHHLRVFKVGGRLHTTLGCYRRFIAAQNMAAEEMVGGADGEIE